MSKSGFWGIGAILILALIPWSFISAQGFDSGSDGSDGALNLTTAGTISFFDPNAFNPPLDPDGDGVYHFTTINIASGVIVDMTRAIRGPVVWLATGEVQIDGTIDLSGERGHSRTEAAIVALPGPGGFIGGNGNKSGTPRQPGQGPGGAQSHSGGSFGGGGGGHAAPGGNGNPGLGGSAYGNTYLLPLIGGSGGAGGGSTNNNGGGGGAGGGAILIASSENIVVNGVIDARGGDGGAGRSDPGGRNSGGGGGSGGSIRLIANILSGNGTITVFPGAAGPGEGGVGGRGWLRLEAFQHQLTGSLSPAGFSTPGPVFLADNLMPVRITSIGGVTVPAQTGGGFNPADLTINQAGQANIEIQARGIPVGTVIQLSMIPQSGTSITIDSSPLSGTLDLSTATATVTIPHGFSTFFVQANWNP